MTRKNTQPMAMGTEQKRFGLTRSSSYRVSPLGQRPSKKQLLHLARRFLGLIAAVYYVNALIASGFWSLRTLFGESHASDNFGSYKFDLIGKYIGTGSVAESPLFVNVLARDSSPREYALYLETEDRLSYTKCTNVPTMNEWLYSNLFMRSNLDALISQTAYNISLLNDVELVVPIVDCTSTMILVGDDTVMRVFYVMRRKSDPTDTFLLMLTISTQDYKLPDHHQDGAAAYVLVRIIRDFRNAKIERYIAMALGYPFEGPYYAVYQYQGLNEDSYVILDSIPRSDMERKTRVLTANRSGFYIKSEESQSNIKNLSWKLNPNSLTALSYLQWTGETVLQNSWGWTRAIYFLFSAYTLFDISILMLVIYRNYQRGKIWIGDAFVSVSSTLSLRGLTVVAIWLMESFWTLRSWTLGFGNTLSGGITIFSFDQIIYGDMLTVYIALAGFLGTILHVRIDPVIVVACFELGYDNRLGLAKWFPLTKQLLVDFAERDYIDGIVEVPPHLVGFSPMRFWTTHPLSRDSPAVLAAMFPVFFSFVIIILYAPLRKFYRSLKPPRRNSYRVQSGAPMKSGKSGGSVMHLNKSFFTVFELATGAELQNRVGLVSDYDSCVYIKGLRYASADGIYSNGFVIANGRWLIKTSDILTIIMMIVVKVRLRDVYAYEVKEHMVNQTARLVYPQTMRLKDLLKLNTTLLA